MKASDRLGQSSSFTGISGRRQLINAATGRSTGRPSSAVKLEQLAHNPFNPRSELNALEETVASLQERGQLTSLTVISRDAFLEAHPGQEERLGEAEWVVLDGNRRLAAAHLAGVEELRIDVNDALASSATELLESALVANLHREEVPPVDEAKALRDLLKIHGSQAKVAQRLSKSTAWVSQRLALLELPVDLQEKVESGALKVKDGRRIGRLPAEQQHREAEKALNRGRTPRKSWKGGSAAGVNPVNAASPGGSFGEAEAEVINPVNDAGSRGFVLGVDGSGVNRVNDGAGDGSGVRDERAVVNRVNAEVSLPLVTSAVVRTLPWDNPLWFDQALRQHMGEEHRERLVWLLTAAD